MAVHIGSKKVKELHYGGKKIKEAWLNGKKVYSSGPQKWRIGVTYRRGDLVTNSASYSSTVYTFKCIRDHISDKDTEPFSGIAESGFWQMISRS